MDGAKLLGFKACTAKNNMPLGGPDLARPNPYQIL